MDSIKTVVTNAIEFEALNMFGSFTTMPYKQRDPKVGSLKTIVFVLYPQQKYMYPTNLTLFTNEMYDIGHVTKEVKEEGELSLLAAKS